LRPRLGRALLETIRRERGDVISMDEPLFDLPELNGPAYSCSLARPI
jgi:hypothetical protein